MKIGFWGAAGTVTGSRFVLDGAKGRMLIDCGMFEGGKQIRIYGNDLDVFVNIVFGEYGFEEFLQIKSLQL